MLIHNKNLQTFQYKQEQFNVSQINYVESRCNKNMLIVYLNNNKKIEMTYDNKTDCSEMYNKIYQSMVNNVIQYKDNLMR